MNWDKKSIAAIFLCIVLFTAYMSYLQHKYPDYYAGNPNARTAETPTTMQGDGTAAPAVSGTPATPGSAESGTPSQPTPGTEGVPETLLSPEELRFETNTRVIEFDQTAGAIRSIKLKNYRRNLEGQEPVELLDSPLTIQGTTQVSDRLGRPGFKAQRSGDSLTLSRVQGQWEVIQTYTVPRDGYGLDVQVSFRNISGAAQELTAGVLMQENLVKPESGQSFFVPTTDHSAVVYSVDGKHHEKLIYDFCSEDGGTGFTLSNEKVDFIGIDRHYFLSLLWAKGQPLNYALERSGPVGQQTCPLSLMASQSFGLVEPSSQVSFKLTGYFGPKQLDVLEAFDPALKNSLKLGWFSVVAYPLLVALKGLYGLVHNYGIAIILITIILKLLFYPLTRAAAISMKKMQKLQPEMNRLREKFKDDPQRQQRELMAFMAQHKVNPFKGCLPILPQIPVFIAFYNVLSQAIELRHAPFYGWLQDLATRDPYYITPILLGIGMFVQQKLTPNPGMDKNQEKIMLMMPIIFTVMMLSLPAGMVLYMMTNTIVSILQQQWLNKNLAKKFP